MKKFITRKRLSMFFSATGICLMGVDLMMTRNFFTHIGELMAASVVCLVIGIVLDRDPKKATSRPTKPAGKMRRQARSS